MGTHTPGPWAVDARTPGDVNGPDGKDVAVAMFRGMKGIEITGHEKSLANIDREEAEANARLIAAAPELLAACLAEQAAREYDWDPGSKKAEEALGSLYSIGYTDEDARIPSEFASQLRRAAIAKATGAA